MRDFLLGSWGPQLVALTKQHPRQVLAAGLTVVMLAIHLMFGRPGSSGGDVSGCDLGDGDGGSCGD